MRARSLKPFHLTALALLALVSAAPAQTVRTDPEFQRNVVPRNDDGSSAAFPLPFVVNFFGKFRSTCYINNNGNITFDGPLVTYTPFGLTATQQEIIAPFFADVDTRSAGSERVTYGVGTINGRRAFAANYINVGYFNVHADKLNSFQVVLIERADTGNGNFDIEFNYDKITWETGDASGGVNGFGGVSASVGWSNGTGNPGTFFELPGSLVPGAFLNGGPQSLVSKRVNNINVGRLVFRARDGQILPPLSVVSSLSELPPATLGEAYLTQMSAIGGSGGYRWALINDPGTTLPGFTLDAGGIFRGTPTQAGVYPFTLSVTSKGDDGDETSYLRSSILVRPTSAIIGSTSCPLPTGVVGSSYRVPLTATGGTPPYTWTWSSFGTEDPVPGLTLSSNGVITGTPVRPGTYLFAFTARSADGQTVAATRNCTMSIQPTLLRPSVASCPTGSATVDVPYGELLTAGGGVRPYRWSVDGQLPMGLGLDATGVLSGIPTDEGSYGFQLRARDAAGQEFTQSCRIQVSKSVLKITSACPMPDARISGAYSSKLTATGGQGPYQWAVLGTLPSGVALRDDTLSGQPYDSGGFGFRLVVADSQGHLGSQPCYLNVAQPGLAISGCPLPNAKLNTYYNSTANALGGRAPYLWSLTSGSLPEGLEYGMSGSIQGKATKPGPASFTLKVTDGSGASTSRPCTLYVEPAVLAQKTECPVNGATVGAAYQKQFVAAGGIAPYTWALDGKLPAGLTLGRDGVLRGTPLTTGAYQFGLQITDSQGQATETACSLNVDLPSVSSLQLSVTPTTVAPASSPNVVVAVNPASTVQLQADLTLAVRAQTGNIDGQLDRDDPSVRFLNGQRTIRVTIPAGATRATVPIASSGTVASTVTVSASNVQILGTVVNPATTAATFQVPRTIPTVSDACYVSAATGSELRLTGITSTRELTDVVVSYPVGSGSVTQKVQLGPISSDYFLNDLSVRTGGAFSVRVPLRVPDGLTLTGNLPVVLSNSVGSAASRAATRCQ